jgi:hypothetical protein
VLSDEEVARLDAVDEPAPLYPDPRWLTGGAGRPRRSPEGVAT